MNRLYAFAGGLLLLLLAAQPVRAGWQSCGGRAVGDDVRRCPDGSLPVYTAGAPPAPAAPAPHLRGRPLGASLLGIWRTSVPGAVWQTPSAIPGVNRLTISPGTKAGDLTLDANGRYVWNAWGGKVGRWERGDADYPIVLIDTVENKRWKVGWDRDHLVIWDGYVWYAGRR